jgi:hypothetical protein
MSAKKFSTALSEKLKINLDRPSAKIQFPLEFPAISSIPPPFSRDNYRGDCQKPSDYFVTEVA